MSRVSMQIKPLHPDLGRNIPWPTRMSAAAAGLDLAAALDAPQPLASGARARIPCGFAMALPCGYEAQVRPRSGLAYRHGVTIANAPGTIDADYRGEVQVLLMNLGGETFVVQPGMRIAQLVVAPVAMAQVDIVTELDATTRGSNGFGSTGP